ncbi:hypothetical protein Tco_0067276 [Tanacetum coccineum]
MVYVDLQLVSEPWQHTLGSDLFFMDKDKAIFRSLCAVTDNPDPYGRKLWFNSLPDPGCPPKAVFILYFVEFDDPLVPSQPKLSASYGIHPSSIEERRLSLAFSGIGFKPRSGRTPWECERCPVSSISETFPSFLL